MRVTYICFILLGIGFYFTFTSPPAFAGVTVPLARPDYTPPPAPPDWELYDEIFTLQEDAHWQRADRLIRKLRDPILMGHVLYQRYMHPTGYRARWKELSNWLQLYADHPNAWRIYKLARKRKPRNRAMPKAPPARVYAQAARQVRTLFTTRRSIKIRRKVVNLTRRERPTQALRYISQWQQKRYLQEMEFDYLLSLIARSYYGAGKIEKAFESATRATRSRAKVTQSDWHAGLAAWRLGDYAMAAFHFSMLAGNPSANEREAAAGGFWASRALRRQGNIVEAEHYLVVAASKGVSFYSLLAMQQLYGESAISWQQAQLDNTKLPIMEHPAVLRAYALEEANQHELAELELLYLQERVGTDEKRALLILARDMNFPALELVVGVNLGYHMQTRNGDLPAMLSESLYPMLDPDLQHYFLLDRALIYALIRQESRFKPHAKSHAGAHGLMQLMPNTAAFISGDRSLARRYGRNQLLDRELNLELGQKYLHMLLSKQYFNGNLIFTLAGYNAGPGNLRRWRRNLSVVEDDPLLFIESIYVTETRKYIKIVLENLWIYRHRFGQEAVSQRLLAADSWPRYVQLDAPPQTAALDTPRDGVN